jgi:hypothetical protein
MRVQSCFPPAVSIEYASSVIDSSPAGTSENLRMAQATEHTL